MGNKIHFWVLLVLLTAGTTYLSVVNAASPPNLRNDIPWLNSAYDGVADIEAAFNHARRQEESQLGLSPNTLDDLDLPSDAVWNGMTVNEKALYLLNDERVARDGMLPGVIGLAFAGIEQHIDAISGRYAQRLLDSDAFGHYEPGGAGIDSPGKRIEQDPAIGSQHARSISYAAGRSASHTDNSSHYYGDTFAGQGACHEFISRSENLATFSVSSTAPLGPNAIPLPLERALYAFIYDDSSSSWGHREAALLQDESLSNPNAAWGFKNNNGSSMTEGFLGVQLLGSPDYEPFGSSSYANSYAVVLVMNIFDPVSDEQQSALGCNYQENGLESSADEVTLTQSCLAGNGRVDLNVTNNSLVSSNYRLEFEGLPARERNVAFEDWVRISITGRRSGSYSAVVKKDGQIVLSESLNFNCAAPVPPVSALEVTIVNACREGNGQVFFQMTNPSAESRPYVIQFESLPNRSTTAAAFGQALRGTTGRADGNYDYIVRSGSRVVDAGQVAVDCG